MIQIADARAPFATADEALAIGQEYLDREIRSGGFPIGIAAEAQPGGYFARISWEIQHPRGGRKAKNKRQPQSAEIGKVARRKA